MELVNIILDKLIQIIPLALTIFFFYLERKRSNELKKRDEILDRPVLTFIRNHNTYYTAKNIGNGAALNIVYKTHHDPKNYYWQVKVVSYSLSKEEETALEWTNSCNCIMAEYTDIFGKVYYSIMQDDRISFFASYDKAYTKEQNMFTLPCKESRWYLETIRRKESL